MQVRTCDRSLSNTIVPTDPTTIDLCLSVFPWAPFRTTKAAVKMHTLLDLRGNIPSFIHVSDGKLHDVHALDLLVPEPGAIYVMDRGYVDFGRLHVLHLAGAFFVTRTKSNIDFHRIYSAQTDRSTGIICDQMIALDGFYTKQDYPAHLRRVRFKDPETGKTLVFLTNQMTLPAATICALYKNRWQVELFFDVATQCTSAYVSEYQGRAVQHLLRGSMACTRGSPAGFQHRFAATPKAHWGRVASRAGDRCESI